MPKYFAIVAATAKGLLLVSNDGELGETSSLNLKGKSTVRAVNNDHEEPGGALRCYFTRRGAGGPTTSAPGTITS